MFENNHSNNKNEKMNKIAFKKLIDLHIIFRDLWKLGLKGSLLSVYREK